ncbi:hypothetical protein FNV43_RR15114 [Rhamnella rubrinervis]|uniref:Uncharacterized protein n=1 Tax=Rhamnella rubrinervis TaxID=2594499 RepID=A0A8K0E2R5_9ROSA|nr:hypothetical protein FNV43_RR15114 [Rhamnella rubrinervis]
MYSHPPEKRETGPPTGQRDAGSCGRARDAGKVVEGLPRLSKLWKASATTTKSKSDGLRKSCGLAGSASTLIYLSSIRH